MTTSDQRRYVMFGQHMAFGEYVDIIHARGGVLNTVVVNVPDPPRPGPIKSFAERVEDYDGWLQEEGSDHRLEVIQLEDWSPGDNEHYVMGFRGVKSVPLREHLKERHGIFFEPLVHPSAVVSCFARLDEGCVVQALADVGHWVRVGAFSTVSRMAMIGHETSIGIDAEISPQTALGSNLVIEDAVRVGMGGIVIEGLHLRRGCVVAAGATVIEDVAENTLVAGVPAVEKKILPPPEDR
jgi:acetyltransferase-like isoleucine patch superfamily enzyme